MNTVEDERRFEGKKAEGSNMLPFTYIYLAMSRSQVHLPYRKGQRVKRTPMPRLLTFIKTDQRRYSLTRNFRLKTRQRRSHSAVREVANAMRRPRPRVPCHEVPIARSRNRITVSSRMVVHLEDLYQEHNVRQTVNFWLLVAAVSLPVARRWTVEGRSDRHKARTAELV